MTHHTDAERAEFEAIMRNSQRYKPELLNRVGDSYEFDTMESAWRGFQLGMQAARRAPAEPVPQWGKAGTCEWYDGYADHSDGGGPYKERVLYTAPQAPAPTNVWQQAVDNALVSAHLGVAGEVTAEEAAKRLNDLICWNIEVATNPRTNGGKVLVSADALAATNPPGAAPVKLPEPVAKIFFDRKGCEVSELPAWQNLRPYGTHKLVSIQQVLDLLAAHGITKDQP